SILLAVVAGPLVAIGRAVVRRVVVSVPMTYLDHEVLSVIGEDHPGSWPEFGPRYRVVGEVRSQDLGPSLDALDGWLAGGVDTIVVSGRLPPHQFALLADTALTHGCRFLSLSQSPELAGLSPSRVWVEGTSYLEFSSPGLRIPQLAAKRVLDVLGASALLVLLSPVLVTLAVLIKLDSKGPVLFRQIRPGRRGEQFGMYKFRSMHSDAEKRLAQDPLLLQKFLDHDCKLPEDDDPRVTDVGRWMRKASLDELPQLLNVVLGDMSLVGPRPLVGPELGHYGQRQATVLSVKPGMTGLWQVTGRSTIKFPERAGIDLEYVRGWSIFRDIWILLRTVPAVVTQRGAH
ncbi:MAG: sugar transferase, partial [Gemmatimonadota bacterium]|nr:sugar transferase [Gemmatimonadota bacterium]